MSSEKVEENTDNSGPGSRRTVVALVISNLEYGGAQRQVVALANNLDPKQFEVHVFSLSSYAPLRDDLTIPPRQYHEVQKQRKYDLSIVLKLRKEFQLLGVDVVHSFLYDAEIAGRVAGWLTGVSLIIGSERNSDYYIKPNQMLFYRLTKFMRHKCIANSSSGAKFNAEQLGYPGEHYSVVRNSVDLERFRPGPGGELRRELGLSENDFVIGMFASFKHQKNHIQLLDALHSLQNAGLQFQVVFVGDILHGAAEGTDQYFSDIRRRITELGLADYCHFAGNRSDVERYYRICNTTVLPSLFEGTPNAVLESMASGVPAIVTDVSDNAQIVDDGGTGFVIDVGDSQALADRLRRFMADRELSEAMGKSAREVAEVRFSPIQLALNTARVYVAS